MQPGETWRIKFPALDKYHVFCDITAHVTILALYGNNKVEISNPDPDKPGSLMVRRSDLF